MIENIKKAFEKVGLILMILTEPIRGKNNPINWKIFQMDVESNVKGIKRHERFRIYPGGEQNIIQIRDTDPKAQQVLLMVHEPVQEYEDFQRITTFRREQEIMTALKQQKFTGIRKVGQNIYYKAKTPGGKRYFLMGVDERQLFIAQLKGPATSIDAARSLLGRSVQFAEGKRKSKRQGEWFLLETNQTMRDEIENAIRKTRAAIRYKANIGDFAGRKGGNPHIADELVVMPRGMENSVGTHELRLQRNRVFVRGKIRHIQHETKKYSHWREVILNDEGQTGTATASGVFYID